MIVFCKSWALAFGLGIAVFSDLEKGRCVLIMWQKVKRV
jgi:hypothetical protein